MASRLQQLSVDVERVCIAGKLFLTIGKKIRPFACYREMEGWTTCMLDDGNVRMYVSLAEGVYIPCLRVLLSCVSVYCLR